MVFLAPLFCFPCRWCCVLCFVPFCVFYRVILKRFFVSTDTKKVHRMVESRRSIPLGCLLPFRPFCLPALPARAACLLCLPVRRKNSVCLCSCALPLSSSSPNHTVLLPSLFSTFCIIWCILLVPHSRLGLLLTSNLVSYNVLEDAGQTFSGHLDGPTRRRLAKGHSVL